MKCKYCGTDNLKEAKFCGRCGAPIRKKNKAPLYIVLILLLIVVAFAVGRITMLPGNTDEKQPNIVGENETDVAKELSDEQEGQKSEESHKLPKEDTIYSDFEKAEEFWYEWIYGQKHIDGDRTVVDSEQPRSVVNHSEINTADKLENEIRNHFGKALADRYIEALNPYDSDGELWINVAWGVGDNFLAIKDHRLKKVNDSEYILTLIMDNTMENKTFEEKLLCTAKDEKWVFTNYVESSPEYILGVWEFSTYPDVENQYKINIKVLQQGALLKNEILKLNPIVEKEPSLKKTSEVAGENGLYKSTDTNSGNPTYYFRGNVENYVDFAGYTWRIVRINEDGTIRLIMQDGIENNKTYNFHASNTHYYLESTLKSTLDLWYEDKIESNKNYADKVSTGEYYCQQAKSAYSSSYATNSGEDMILYSDYTPNFKCEPNKEKKGIVESNIGLLTYDEVVFAGGYYNASNTTYYLYNNNSYWTMSTSGNPAYDYSRIWGVSADGKIDIFIVIFNHYTTRPVINLKADTIVTGTGKSDDHFIVQ